MPTITDDLLHWVDLLRQPTRTPHLQSKTYDVGGREHTVACVSFSTEDGRLAQLRAAIVGGIGSHEGASSNGIRIPFNEDARQLYEAIEGAISIMFVDLVNEPVHATPEKTLTAWYLAYMDARAKGRIGDETHAHNLRVVRGWCTSINDLFHPWRRREWNAPCPLCHEMYGWLPDGTKVRALVMEYREDELGMVEIGAFRCRFCYELEAYGRAGAHMVLQSVQAWEDTQNRYVDGLVPEGGI